MQTRLDVGSVTQIRIGPLKLKVVRRSITAPPTRAVDVQ